MILNPENDELTEEQDKAPETAEDAPEQEFGIGPDETVEAPAAEDAADDNAPDEPTDEDPAEAEDVDDTAADVVFEDNRPIVQELEYQAPRQKAGTAEEEEPAEDTRFSSVAEARAVVEGFLFSSNEPLSVSRLSKLMGNLHPKTVRGLLLELQWEYDNRGGALQVTEIAGGYQMCTRPFVAPWMFRLHKLKRRSPLSPATLETLAIIAYRQPITKGEIEGIRGVETGAPIRTLQELGLIEAGGRREVIGRPQLYITTEQFLKVFGLKSIADLPSISELKSRFSDEQKLKPKVAAAPEPAPSEEAAESNAEEPEAEISQAPEVEVVVAQVDEIEVQVGPDISEGDVQVGESIESTEGPVDPETTSAEVAEISDDIEDYPEPQ